LAIFATQSTYDEAYGSIADAIVKAEALIHEQKGRMLDITLNIASIFSSIQSNYTIAPLYLPL
jgi:hypothetical protein